MTGSSVDTLFATWDREAEKTVELLKRLPKGQYDFRPDPASRSLGELAWHIAEVDAYVSLGVSRGEFSRTLRPENIQRPLPGAARLGPGPRAR